MEKCQDSISDTNNGHAFRNKERSPFMTSVISFIFEYLGCSFHQTNIFWR